MNVMEEASQPELKELHLDYSLQPQLAGNAEDKASTSRMNAENATEGGL